MIFFAAFCLLVGFTAGFLACSLMVAGRDADERAMAEYRARRDLIERGW